MMHESRHVIFIMTRPFGGYRWGCTCACTCTCTCRARRHKPPIIALHLNAAVVTSAVSGVQDMVAGLPEDLVSRYSGYVYFPFQDQGHVPLWFEPYLQRAQRTTKR